MLSSKVNRPIMRYHGGKWSIAQDIINEFPAHEAYIEPYGGAASLLMRKAPAILDVYNDIDCEIVDVFSVLRDKELSEELKKRLFYTPYSRAEWKESFTMKGAEDDIVERVRRTLVRSWQTIGTYNFTSKRLSGGWRGVAYKRDFHPNIDFLKWQKTIDDFTERLRCVVIENQPATQVMKRYDNVNALFYVDPPYVAETRRKGRANAYAHEMTDEEHIDMLDTLIKLKGMVVLSGYTNKLYDEKLLPLGWVKKSFKAHADGNAHAGNRGKLAREEFIWINPSAAQKRRQMELF